MDKSTIERLRQFAGAISRATNNLIIRKADDLQKHPGDHDQQVHDPTGGQGGGAKPEGGDREREVNRFKEVYRDVLSQRAGKGDYPAYTPEEVATTVERMTTALAGRPLSFSANPALRAVAAKLGITSGEKLHEWMKERYPTSKSTESGNLDKHGDHDQSTHGNREGAGGGERAEGKVVSSRTHIAGEHTILEVKDKEGKSHYVTAYKPSAMFRDMESERPLGTHGSLKDAEERIQDHKDRLIADWNARGRERQDPSDYRAPEMSRAQNVVDSAIRDANQLGGGRVSHENYARQALRNAGIRATDREVKDMIDRSARQEERRIAGAKPTAEERDRHDDPEYQPPQHEREKVTQTTDLSKYIRHEDGKWTVYSESGKPMGTYDSESGAKERLRQVEAFKHMKKAVESLRNLIGKKW